MIKRKKTARTSKTGKRISIVGLDQGFWSELKSAAKKNHAAPRWQRAGTIAGLRADADHGSDRGSE